MKVPVPFLDALPYILTVVILAGFGLVVAGLTVAAVFHIRSVNR